MGMTVNEWAEDFKSFVNELQMPRDDYNGIMEYIDDAIVLLKEQETVVRCKDCIEYKEWGTGKICMRLGSYYGDREPDDFCSLGIRW